MLGYVVTLGACGRLVKDSCEDVDLVVESPTYNTVLLRELGGKRGEAMTVCALGFIRT